ncbi:putative ATP binding protein [Tieghemostelium lacteum]|uniref:Putative ATP binding protein n=1 Tax=Tieghemostelium lacteum TaxID=361077 RepID=A0A151Z662_TIELA|nr:putative ATP binding protein [Tieghemostelium lacteum]|eukprot:KYQ89451.1 putative ATP binding protein [Tieghemostelium lacteum]
MSSKFDFNFSGGNAIEPYYIRIKGILSKYHESTILKELLQNADDAFSTKVIIKHDTKSYPTESLFSDECKVLQGPSLLVYSNSIFQEKDWVGIKKLGSGSKENDLKSVGKFGLGVNSVYHATDYLTIVSDRYLLMQDPLGNINKDGMFVNFVEQTISEKYPDQVEPFKQFGCDMRSSFNGTIIRLAIRSKPSFMKPQYIQDYKPIINEFIQQLNELLLFLKNINTVEVYHDDTLQFRVSITNPESIGKKRTVVHDYISKIADSMGEYSLLDFMNIIKGKRDLPLESFIMDLEYQTSNGKELNSYCLTHGLITKGLSTIPINEGTKLIPWGGTAVPLNLNINQLKKFEGIPFTFLPIGSLRYSIPFHFNGFFVLSDARTDILFSSTKLEHSQEYQHSKWNENILSNIIPELYNSSLLFMVQRGMFDQESNLIYHHFPYHQHSSEKDKILSSHIVKRLSTSQLFQDIKTLQFHYLQSCYCVTEKEPIEIRNILHERSIPTIEIPTKLLQFLIKQGCVVNMVTPQYICSLLKRHPIREFCEITLKYLISDFNTISQGYLEGVKVFPIANGTLASLRRRRRGLMFTSDYYLPDKHQFTLMKSRSSHKLYDITKSNLIHYNITSLFQYYTASHYHQQTFIIDFKNSFPELVGIHKVLKELPSDFNFQVFWDYMINQDNTSIFDFVCVPATTNDERFVYVSPNYPKILLDSMSESIRKIGVLFGFVVVQIDGKHSKSIIKVKSNENFINGLTKESVSTLNSDDRTTLRKYLISEKRTSSQSDIIFRLPIFNNSNGTFSNITNYSLCTNWTEMKNYSLGKEYVFFEDSQLNLQNWPTTIHNKHQTIVKFVLPHMDQYNIDSQLSIAKLIIVSPETFKPLISSDYKWIPNHCGTLSSINDVYLLNQDQEDLLKYTPLGESQIISHQLTFLKSDSWKTIGVKYNYSPINLVKDCLTNLPNLPEPINSEGIPKVLNYMFRNEITQSIILSIPFIPVIKELQLNENMNYQDIVSIQQCYLKVHKDLCYSQVSIADIDPNIMKNFNNNLPIPTCEMVIAHLNYLIDNWTDSEEFDQMEAIEKIYSFLNQHQIELPNNMNWVWNGYKFVSPTKTFVNGTSIDPYIFEIPQNLKKFNKLYEKSHIPTSPSFRQYAHILETIYKESNGMVLDDSKFKITLKIVSEISNISVQDRCDLYLPTTKMTLVKQKNIIFSDIDELHLSLKSFSILHRDISFNVAKSLGIQSSSSAILKGKPIPGHDFGQYEELVTRIKNINEEYKVESFLKEMVQNSDDSGATVLEIILDKRKYHLKDLDSDLPTKFKDYLEPSLVIFNNSKFTDQDIQNIQRLGSSYKKEDVSKIGQYGIGFNSVYNFTNVPSIITRDSLYVFDPLRSHFSVEKSPGRSFEFSLRDQLIDIFQPLNYPNLGLTFDCEFENTIIRLPLRKHLHEKISNNKWNIESITKTIGQFKDSAEQCLLFQKHLNKISFSIIEDDGSNQSVETFSIEKTIHKGFNPSELNQILYNFNWKQPFMYLTHLEISQNRNQEIESNQWIIGWCVGSSQKGILHSIYQNLSEKIVPIGSVAICFTKEIKGIPFTFLPLPKSTELPIHVNGSFILNSSRQDVFNSLGNDIDISTLPISTTSGSEQEKSIWNISIVQEILSSLYINTLNDESFKLHYEGIKRVNDFYKIFPHSDTTLWNRITKNFYENANDKEIFAKLELDKEGEITFKWSNLSECDMIIHSLDNHIEIIKILLLDGCNIYLVPENIYKKLKNNQIPILSSTQVSKFYQSNHSFYLTDPPKPSLKSIDNILTLVKFVTISDVKNLYGTPFMLLYNETKSELFSKWNRSHLIFNQEYYSLNPDSDIYLHPKLCSIVPWLDVRTYAKNPNFPEFFQNYLVSKLHSFKYLKECIPILSSLKSHWNEFSNENINLLINISIVPVLNEENNEILKFNKVSKYYHPDVLKIVKPKYQLPPPLNDISWLPILMKLSIRCSLTTNNILKQLKNLELNPNEIKFNNLYEYLKFHHPHEVSSVLQSLKNCKIFPCVTESDHIGFLSSSFSSLTNSVDSSLSHLCFTVIPTRKLRLIFPETVEQERVEKHLHNLLKEVEKWKNQDKLHELSTILEKIMKYIDEKDWIVNELPNNYLFPIDSQLFPVGDIVVDDSDSLDPFFKVVPKNFLKYRHTILKLGFSSLTDKNIISKLSSMKNMVIGEHSKNKFVYLLNKIQHSLPPVLLDSKYHLRSHNQVYHVPKSSINLINRIDVTGLIFEVHRDLVMSREKLKIQSIQDMVIELLDEEKSSYKVESTIFIDFSDKNIISGVHRQLEKVKDKRDILSRFQTLKVYSGNILSKFTLISQDKDVTKQPKGSSYIYNSKTNSVYFSKLGYNELSFYSFLTSAFTFNVMDIYEDIQALKSYQIDVNPLHNYSNGDIVLYSKDGVNMIKSKVVMVLENLKEFFSELKFYQIQIQDGKLKSVSSIHLYKQSSAINYSDISFEPQSIQQLYNEVYRQYGDGWECQRVLQFASQIKVIIKTNSISKVDKASNKQYRSWIKTIYKSAYSGNYNEAKPNHQYYNIFKEQAKYDLETAEYLHQGGFYAPSCFYSQQTVEKICKSYCYLKGISFNLSSHMIFYNMISEIDCSEAHKLESHYISTRYPPLHGSGSTVPFKSYNQPESSNFIQIARDVYNSLITVMNPKE